MSEQEKAARYVCGHGRSFAVACPDCDVELGRDLLAAAPEPQTAPPSCDQCRPYFMASEWHHHNHPDPQTAPETELDDAERAAWRAIDNAECALQIEVHDPGLRVSLAHHFAKEARSILRAALSGERPAPKERATPCGIHCGCGCNYGPRPSGQEGKRDVR